VEDLDHEVLAPFAEDLHLLLLEDLAGAVVGIDHMVAELELDALDLGDNLEVLDQLCFDYLGNVVLLRCGRPGTALSKSADSGPRG
jgi:hypothetical protein